ncbi:MAG: ABC transporter permease [Oscillospiraceae bacterium]|nr:ABC transporter permease [Oscillospiraceae bacterium]
MIAVFKKELRAFFFSTMGYVFIGTFLLINTLVFLFYVLFTQYPTSNFGNVLNYLSTFLIFIIPILTMRAFSEEKKNRTDQLLYTLPVKIFSIVIGKFLASLCLFVIALLITSIYVMVLSFFGNIAIMQLLSTYFGFFLLGTSYIALGLFISSFTENQVVAAILTIISLFMLLIVDAVSKNLSGTTSSGVMFIALLILIICAMMYYFTRNYIISLIILFLGAIILAVLYFYFKDSLDGILGQAGTFISLIGRYETFSSGILDIGSIVYYISFIAVFIYLTFVKIEQERFN